MSPSEESASIWLKLYYAISSGAFVVIGIQMFMCIYGLIVFNETTPSQRKGRGIYIAINFIIFTLYVLSELGDGYEIFELLLKTESALDAQALRRIDDHLWWSIGCSICSTLINWIGDGLLIYRCYIIFRGAPWVSVLPATVYLASIASSTYVTVSLILSGTNLQSRRYNPRALSAWMFLSVALNCTITILISYKLIKSRLEVAKLLPYKDSSTNNSALSILVESALPLSISGVAAAAVVTSNSDAGQIIDALALFLWVAFNALSPQLIIFRVTIGRSWSHKGPETASSTPESHRRSLDISFTQSSLQPPDRERGLGVIEEVMSIKSESKLYDK